MFAGSVETVTTPEVKTKKVSTTKAEIPTVDAITGVPGQEPEVIGVKVELPKENTITPPMSFDFSQLGADLGNLNLGE
jgi:hypothetical protein